MPQERRLSSWSGWKRTTTSRTSITTSKFPKITKRNNALDGTESPIRRAGAPERRTEVSDRRAGPPVRRIVGVDPGLAAAGWGIVDVSSSRLVYVAHGCIKTEAGLPRSDRLLTIYRTFRAVLEEYEPTEAAIETLYFSKNITSAMPVAEARGVLCLAMAERGLMVGEYTPMAIKQAVVGRGGADKAQVQELVRLILGLDGIPKPDHAADALGAAVCRAHDNLPIRL